MPPLTILIVDDELQSRSLIKKLLSVHFPKFITDEAETVEMAIKKIRQNFTNQKTQINFYDLDKFSFTGNTIGSGEDTLKFGQE